MSTPEHYTVLNDSGQTAVRLALKLTGVLLLISVLAAVLLGVGSSGRNQMRANVGSAFSSFTEGDASWTIEGALTEACTCSVPCTCNFGEGPSPHHYCYSLYAYDIRKGKYGNVTLDGLRFGATELKSGKTIFIDERADERQRHALRVLAARIISHLSAEEAEKRANSTESSVRVLAVKQEYDSRRHHLDVAGVGEFSADYIMGLDKTNPVVVRNNTTWRILDAIKGKTSVFRAKVGKDTLDVKDTNSNQGDFLYTDKMNFASSEYSSCSSQHEREGTHA